MATSTLNSSTSALPASEGGLVLAFKNTLNTVIPKFTNQGENPVSTKDDSLLEPSMLIALDNSMSFAQTQIKINAPILAANNTSLYQRIQSMSSTGIIDKNFIDIIRELQATRNSDAGLSSIISNTGTIIDGFESLSPQTQSKISTAQALFIPTSSNKKNATEQGYESVRTTQSYLGINDADTTMSDGSVVISEKTSKAIRDRMIALQGQNPDLGQFDAPVFDKRAVAFLENLQAKQMKNAGVTKDTLKTALLQLWSEERLRPNNPNVSYSKMSDLGETSSLLSSMRYMVSGGLNNGGETTPPSVQKSWDLQWKNNDSGEHFFNPDIYSKLVVDGSIGINELLQKSPFKSRDENLVEAIQRIKEKANTPEGKENKPLQEMITIINNFELHRQNQTLTQHQVGMIGIEIMSIQAGKLCIADKDINKAIDEGRFMPHLADLGILNTGLGYPPGSLAQLPPEQRYHDVFAEAGIGISLLKYRSAAFESRFGTISDETAQKVKEAKYREPSKVETQFIFDTLQSPAKRYNSQNMSGTGEIERNYEQRRQSYLNSLGMRLQENGCKTPGLNAGTDDNKSRPSTTAAVPVTVPPGGGAGAAAGGRESNCVADKTGQGDCSKPSGGANLDSTCVADKTGQGPCSKQFGSAVGSGADGAHAAIAETIASTTGSPAGEPVPDICTVPADKLSQGGCKVVSNVRP